MPSPQSEQGPKGWFVNRPWLAIVLLMTIGMLNLLDRVLPSILAEGIKQDLGMNDTVFGLINGIIFLVIYAGASIPIARFTDRGNQNLVVVASLGIWSCMTALGGLAQSVWFFALSRMGVAFGEAGGTPAAHAYILKAIPLEQRTLALSVYTLSVPLGSMAGYVIGGIVGQALGWRQTFLLMGAIGLVVTVFTTLALGANRPITTRSQAQNAKSNLPISLLLKKPSVILLLIGTSFIGMAGYTTIVFTPSFLMRSYEMTMAQAGLSYGIGGGVAGIISLLSLGYLADRLARRDPRWLLGCIISFILICLPLSIMAFMVENRILALVGLSLNHAILISHVTPVFAALQGLTPPELRARASALLLLGSAVLGGLGPPLAGVLSDSLSPQLGSASLGYALLIVPAAFTMAAIFYSLALTRYKRDLV